MSFKDELKWKLLGSSRSSRGGTDKWTEIFTVYTNMGIFFFFKWIDYKNPKIKHTSSRKHSYVNRCSFKPNLNLSLIYFGCNEPYPECQSGFGIRIQYLMTSIFPLASPTTWSHYVPLVSKSENYLHRPTRVIPTCFVLTHMHPRKFSNRSPNLNYSK